ncbi:MFS transporter [Ruminiclostridium sufflavum DSM 19573]|uniref:MFS transporter n=1 Tax=Ruminiclostridium sufflavum DSM 19573 TaxID=1121337 RepID=A0A318XKW6_9FIRM|nr:MFS transporter [Ruminiclostridium sufflavum]PYG87830.1 MFS transporter [Ruminiclostridium sufflavum DSM 19573]
MEKNKALKLNFILLAWGRLVSSLGSSIFSFAMSLYVLDSTGSAATFSFIVGLTVIPRIVVNLIAGAFVDRHNKKKIMVFTDIISGLSIFAFFAAFRLHPNNIMLFAAYVLMLGTIQSVFALACNASIPSIVERETVPKLNSALQSVGAVIDIAGPVLGAVLYKAIGISSIMIINGILFTCAGISEIFIKFFNAEKEKTVEKRSYMSDIVMTYKYLFENRTIAFFLIFAAAADFVLLPFLQMILPFINYNILKVSGIQLSFIQASCAIGTIIGAMVVSAFKDTSVFLKRFFILFSIQAVLLAACIFPEASVFGNGSKWIVTVVFGIILLVFGAANAIQNIPMITFFQLQVPGEMRARIYGMFMSALYITAPPGMWLYGFLMDKFEWYYITAVSGIVLLVFGITAAGNKIYKDFLKSDIFQKDGAQALSRSEAV